MAAAPLGRVGPYELISELGRGGMGVVYRARHVGTGTERALKVMLAQDPALEARFRREAQSLARVAGEGIVPIHEAGSERGRFYFVMGLMPGGSLDGRLKERGRLEWREAVTLVAQVARALAKCHANGIVHRDLKPGNVLFDEEGRPRLSDFGCVRDLDARSLTETGIVIGTPAYMAPEQLDGAKVDARADVYALGVVLYQLVSGAVPHVGRSPIELLAKKMHEKPRSLASSGVPAALDAVLARALEIEPEKRFANAGELAAALEKLDGHKLDVAPARSRLPLAALGLVPVLALAIALGLVSGRTAPTPAAPPEPPPPPAAPSPPTPPPAPLPMTESVAAQRIAKVLENKRALPEERLELACEVLLDL